MTAADSTLVRPRSVLVNEADLYLKVRQIEGRLFPDEVVARLPDFPSDHPLRSEWLARRDSARRLIRYLRSLNRPLTVLDLGCGNGWLDHRISELPSIRVWGLDRLGPEISQAARLFSGPSSAFLITDVFAPPFPPRSFDIIILASSLQYFPDLASLLAPLRRLLRDQGEIQILDTPIYAPAEVDTARRRTEAYYSHLGFPEMAGSYFHHTAASLEPFHPEYLYRPDGLGSALARRLARVASPFPWIRIRRDA